MSDAYQFTWRQFQENTKAFYKELKTSPEFSDVTLVCGDGVQMEAHKLVLASGSKFFQRLLRGTNQAHPLIYLRGIRSQGFSAILDYIYQGEAAVLQEDIEEFLSTAEDLGLHGFKEDGKSRDVKGEKVDENPQCDSKQVFKLNPSELQATASAAGNRQTQTTETDTENENREFVNTEDSHNENRDYENTEDTYNISIEDPDHENRDYENRERQEKVEKDDMSTKVSREATISSFNNLSANSEESPLKKEQETKYGFPVQCKHCDFGCQGPQGMKMHLKNCHQKERRKSKNSTSKPKTCEKCKFTARKKSELVIHVEREHNERKRKNIYKCLQCDFETMSTFSIMTHKQSKHEGIRYDCNDCEYQATTRGNLNRHKLKYHE